MLAWQERQIRETEKPGYWFCKCVVSTKTQLITVAQKNYKTKRGALRAARRWINSDTRIASIGYWHKDYPISCELITGGMNEFSTYYDSQGNEHSEYQEKENNYNGKI